MRFWSILVDVERPHPVGHVSKVVDVRPDLSPDLIDALEQVGVSVRVHLLGDDGRDDDKFDVSRSIETEGT